MYHWHLCDHLSKVIHLGAIGQLEQAQTEFDKLELYLSRNESQIHSDFDLFLFCRAYRSKLNMPLYPYYD